MNHSEPAIDWRRIEREKRAQTMDYSGHRCCPPVDGREGADADVLDLQIGRVLASTA